MKDFIDYMWPWVWRLLTLTALAFVPILIWADDIARVNPDLPGFFGLALGVLCIIGATIWMAATDR